MTRPPAAGRDPEREEARRWDYWRRVCAGLPPLSSDEIAAVGVILRRIEEQRAWKPRSGVDG